MAGIIAATAGPITGFVVQPVVGAFSDFSRSRFGRRRPFILAGSMATGLFMLVLAFSPQLGHVLGDRDEPADWRSHRRAIGIAVAGLWLANIAVNTAHGPSRAIVVDLADEARQHEANAMVSASQALSAVVANAVGALLFLTPKPYTLLFATAAIAVVVLSLPTLVSGRESPDFAARPRPTASAMLHRMFSGFGRMNSRARGALFVFFLSWAALAPFFVFSTSFWGQQVFGPNGDYDRGVQRGLYGLAIMAASGYAASFVLSPAIKRWGVRTTYSVLQILGTVGLALFYYVPRWHASARIVNDTAAMSAETFALMAIVGVHYSAVNAVPYAIVAEEEQGNETGLSMGLLNAACVTAQALANVTASWLIHRNGQDVSVGISIGAFPGAICCLVAPLALPGGSRGKRIVPPTFGQAEDESSAARLLLPEARS